MSHLPDLDQLPTDILTSVCSVVWNAELRDGKSTKVPYIPHRPTVCAKVNDPTTWNTFAVAYDAVADGKADGVGIVLPGDGLIGVDLDGCVEPESGLIRADARALVEQINSYTEITPSGHGLRIFVRGQLPPGPRIRQGPNHTGVEIYDRSKYLTVTGQHLAGTPRTIETRDLELAAAYACMFGTETPPASVPPRPVQTTTLDDATLLVKASTATNGATFSALWAGDVSAYGGDESAADLALSSLLSFWTGRDGDRMDRLFRQSGLMRSKWDSRRRDSTYGADTIAKAIATCQQVYTPVEVIEIDDTPDDEAADVSAATVVMPTTSPTVDRWPTLPDEALIGLFGDFVRAIAPHTEADPVALLVHVVVLWGNLVGRSPRALVGADVHHLNENALIVGETASGRKNMALSEALAVLAEVDPEWAQTRVQSGLSSGEGFIFHVRDPQDGSEPIREKGRIVGYQTIQKDAGVTDKRLAVIETEFAKTLRVSRREGNTLSATVRQAWDTGDLRVLTRRDPVRATGAHASILAHVTPMELRQELKTTDMASGFINRFLLALVRRSQSLPHGGRVEAATRQALVDRFTIATDFARRTQQIARDAEANTFWARVYPAVTRERTGLVGALSARAPAHILRLSMLYALADRSSVITLEHLKAACALWEYTEASGHLIFGRRIGHRLSDYLLILLRSQPGGLTRTQIHEALGRNRHVDEINEALERLLDYGLVTTVKVRSTDGIGRPITMWIAQNTTK